MRQSKQPPRSRSTTAAAAGSRTGGVVESRESGRAQPCRQSTADGCRNESQLRTTVPAYLFHQLQLKHDESNATAHLVLPIAAFKDLVGNQAGTPAGVQEI